VAAKQHTAFFVGRWRGAGTLPVAELYAGAGSCLSYLFIRKQVSPTSWYLKSLAFAVTAADASSLPDENHSQMVHMLQPGNH
jgi:hypothetical protein